jgi:hypothetical protein
VPPPPLSLPLLSLYLSLSLFFGGGWSHRWIKLLQMLCGSEVRLLVLHACFCVWYIKLLYFLFSLWTLQKMLKCVTTFSGILARLWGMLQWIVMTVLL